MCWGFLLFIGSRATDVQVGGVGGAEAAMVALLSLEGVGLETSVPATAIIRVTTLWFAIGIGLILFPIAEKHSKRGAHALEDN